MQIGRNHIGFGVLILSIISVASLAANWEQGKRAYEKGDYAAALRELRPLAENGNAKAQALLGLMYNLGRGLPQDMGQALHLYRAAAEQGDAEAEFHLGTMCLNGSGVARDTVQGLKWLKMAADQGMVDAYLMLGMAYMNLKDAPRDVVQADMWLRLAAEQGDPLAKGQLARLEIKMTRAQTSKAQALAAEWKQKTDSR